MTTTLAISNLKGGVAKTTTCLSFGQPVTLYAPNTRGTAQYRALAQELITHG
jgi:cellulose biosynthesis protein BcsQ